jgi:hypothetical protein
MGGASAAGRNTLRLRPRKLGRAQVKIVIARYNPNKTRQ